MISHEQMATFLRQLPALDALETYLSHSPEDVIHTTFPEPSLTITNRIVYDENLFLAGDEGLEIPPSPQEQAAQLVESGRQAVAKLRHSGLDAQLEPQEAAGLEAIVSLVARPAIFIQNGRFFPPPMGWERLEDHREAIERTLRSVGRIEVAGHPARDWIGTGFLVGDGVIMTNRHVVKEFSARELDGRWLFEPGMLPRIDYTEDLGMVDAAEFALTEVIGVHETLDMALLRVAQQSSNGLPAPAPLPLASHGPTPAAGRSVYIVGYPAWDGHRNDPDQMRRIFANIYSVKRLQPGTLLNVYPEHSRFTHDCSTLGGNSGSCVIDLDMNMVIGLHYWGRYQQANRAIALWLLHDDPLLHQAGIAFV